jgi:glycosyltransferase involved in cell wall biosynthesis
MNFPMPKVSLPNIPIFAFYGFRGGEGGISHVMLNLMNAVAEKNLRVQILLHAENIPELAHLSPKIEIVHLGHVGSLRRIFRLSRYFKQQRPEYLLVNREPANRTAVAARILTGASVKIVVRVGMAISVALERRAWLKRQLRKWGIVFCYHRADVVIANAKDVARDIEEITGLPRSRVAVLENPTVTPEMLDQAAQSVDHPWFQPGMPPVILGVGRLARQKDFPTLLKAFSRVRKERPCHLVILGEGKERSELQRLAGELGVDEDIELAGFAPNPFQYMSRSALFVLSSAWEGSPNVLIQALALGIPCVSTDCPGGSREILGEGKYGQLVPVGDENTMADAMRRYLESPPPPQTLQQAAQRYRADVCADAYLKAIGLEGFAS